ncbi:glycosyltransferase family 8 protein [Megasphaera cerevisiae]|uniref:glycosyltransferase family 8 protein n=1 Tax=Megasphaera cerevisiae TaxID=39029 RepID=UPI001364A982|nr:glycosyltransferase [Megasphaera cerevisiae]
MIRGVRKIDNLYELEKLDKSRYVDELYPAFDNVKEAIVFESSSFFVPYQDVVLKSLVEHTNEDEFYDIVILTNEIDAYDCNLLQMEIAGRKNISLRFFDPTSYVKKYVEKSRYKYLTINYFRMALPWIFKKYDRVLNLGADIVIEKDVMELLHCPMKHNEYIAGAIDLGYLGRLKMDISPDELGLCNPDGYVNADVLVFNNVNIRRDFTMDNIMALWQKYYFRCAEQDALNMLFDGHIHHIDLRWNLFPPRMASVEHISHNTINKIELWKKSMQDPYIIHYAAYPKPWDYPLVGFGDCWWKYARTSPYYEEILRRLTVNSVRGELGINRLWIQKIGDRFVKIVPRSSRAREVIKRIYAAFFTPPNKEWGEKFAKKR